MSCVGTEFDPPKKEALGIADVDVLYHALSEMDAKHNRNAQFFNAACPFKVNATEVSCI